MMRSSVHDVIDSLEIFICGLDDTGTILVFNRPCEQLTGFLRDQAVGTNWLEIFAKGERHEQVRTLWDQAILGTPSGPYVALCRNGRSLRWHFSRWGQSQVPPSPVVLWAVGLDITDERAALVRARELERMVALANLVSGLTHEIRNPLNGALLQLALAERQIAKPVPAVAEVTEAIDEARAEVQRISALLDDFLVFARPLPVRLERADLRDVVHRAIDRARARALANDVTINFGGNSPASAEIDAARVESATYQLLANAIDAASNASDRSVYVLLATRDNTIAIDVEDGGAGLPSQDAPVFEPFFTTKRGGTGLGLAIVERVAIDHGGAITHQRRNGTTVFRLELPIVGGVRS